MLLVAGTASAQTYFNFGYGLADNCIKFGSMDTDHPNSNVLFAGVSHNFGLSNEFGLETGLNFAYDFAKDGLDIAEVKSKYLGFQAPVLFNYAFRLADDFTVKIFLGPTLSLGLMNKDITFAGGEKMYEVDYYADNSLNRFNVSASAAVAAEWANTIRLKLGYDYGLTDYDPSDSIKRTENVLAFTIGYMF